MTPCKRGRAMNRMPSSLFLQSLNDVHFIKEEKKKGLQEALSKRLSLDEVLIRMEMFHLMNVMM